MPVYIQSKVFAYKSWQPPNFRVYVPPKALKDKEREPELELGEIREETVLEDNPTISQDVDQSMEDVDDATHPDEDSFQEHSVLETLGAREAVVELEVNEVIREMTPEPKHTPRSDAESRQKEKCILEEVDGKRKPTVDNKDDTGTEGNIDEEKDNKSADAAKEKPGKKKSKPRKKKVSPEDQTTQSLGDKVTPFILELCDYH